LKLLIQPGDGITALLDGIRRAKSRIEVAIFRFDRREIEKALADAVKRGVSVHALIAHTNRGGEHTLRALELRLLAAGVTVARTADDLARYHDKYIIVDRQQLYVLAFNFTHLDIERSRSFGLITTDRKLVQEAAKLFEADAQRQPYLAASPAFIVSPVNARRELARFIKGAKQQLLIYDPEISDPEMVRLLTDRSKAGVEVRILGRLTRKSSELQDRKLLPMRLHTRTMIRDGRQAFIGSQSLRQMELDGRREVGILVRNAAIAGRLMKVFEQDWEAKEAKAEQTVHEETPPVGRIAKHVARSVAKALPPVAPAVEIAIKEVAGDAKDIKVDPQEVEEAVQDAVKEAIRTTVHDLVSETPVEH
jgi:cardiolipin synthase A/B